MLENVLPKLLVLSTVAPFVIKTLIDLVESLFADLPWYKKPENGPAISTIKKIVSILFGLGASFVFDLKAFAIVGIGINVTADLIITGLFLGKGSNVINDLLVIINTVKLDKLNYSQQIVKLDYLPQVYSEVKQSPTPPIIEAENKAPVNTDNLDNPVTKIT